MQGGSRPNAIQEIEAAAEVPPSGSMSERHAAGAVEGRRDARREGILLFRVEPDGR